MQAGLGVQLRSLRAAGGNSLLILGPLPRDSLLCTVIRFGQALAQELASHPRSVNGSSKLVQSDLSDAQVDRCPF